MQKTITVKRHPKPDQHLHDDRWLVYLGNEIVDHAPNKVKAIACAKGSIQQHFPGAEAMVNLVIK